MFRPSSFFIGVLIACANSIAFVLTTSSQEPQKFSFELPNTWVNRIAIEHELPEFADWVKDFHTDELTHLIAEALLNNKDLKVARLNLEAIVALTVVNSSKQWPRLDANLSSQHSLINDPKNLLPLRLSQLSLDFSWEVDIWRRLKNVSQATQQEFHGAQHDYRSAYLSLGIRVAKLWLSRFAK